MKKWELFKSKLLTLFGGLFLENKGNGKYMISLGRIAFWATFIPAVIIWCSGIRYSMGVGVLQTNQTLKDIPNGLLQFLLAITGYNLTKHIGNVVSNVWGGNTSTTTTSTETSNTVEDKIDTSDTDHEGHGDV